MILFPVTEFCFRILCDIQLNYCETRLNLFHFLSSCVLLGDVIFFYFCWLKTFYSLRFVSATFNPITDIFPFFSLIVITNSTEFGSCFFGCTDVLLHSMIDSAKRRDREKESMCKLRTFVLIKWALNIIF